MAIIQLLPSRWRVRANALRHNARDVVRALREERRKGARPVTGRSHVELRHVPKRNLRTTRSVEGVPSGGVVVFAESGLEIELGADQTILEAGLEHGVDLLFSCTLGGCGACMLQVVEGEVVYDEPDAICLTDDEIEDGCCLACVGRPSGRVVLEA